VIRVLAIQGYRSLRDIRLPLGPLTVVTGPNGSGKSSVYRALRLMTDIAHGRVIASLALEGGLQSTLWAGPEELSPGMRRGEVPVQGTARRKGPVSLRLGFAGDDYGYAIDVGLPVPSQSAFARDPAIKVEALWHGEVAGRHNTIAERRGASVRVRDREGEWQQAHTGLAAWDSMMTHCADPREAAELLLVRDAMRDWRFYDHFDTGRDAPSRRPQVGTRTPVLAGDGADVAAAVQTIREMGDGDALARAVADAFDGASLEVEERAGYFELAMRQRGLLRPLAMTELSDGTLRYLLLATALLSPRPPGLMILNEPETSLHADLLAPLARLVVNAASRTQLVVVSHATALVRALGEARDTTTIPLRKELGETVAETEETPRWSWPAR
jgi:predicted ATPase